MIGKIISLIILRLILTFFLADLQMVLTNGIRKLVTINVILRHLRENSNFRKMLITF